MTQYIDKAALVAEIEKIIPTEPYPRTSETLYGAEKYGKREMCFRILDLINTLEVKEVDWEKERMSECPYRQVVCTMYEGKTLECKGACSWVVDYPKLKELKTRKGE